MTILGEKLQAMARGGTARLTFKGVASVLVVVLLFLAITFWFGRTSFALSRAQGSMAERDWDSARRWLERAESWNSNNGETQFLFARIDRKCGRMEDARARLARAMQLGFNREKIQREEWLALAQQGELASTMMHLETLLADQQGDGPEICEAFVQGFLRQRQFSGASDLLDAWIADFPRDPMPYYMRGTLHQEFQRWEKAETDLRQALKYRPGDGEIAMSLGVVLVTRQFPSEAIEIFKIAERDETRRHDALTGQALCFRLLGKRAEGRQMVERVLAEDPDHVQSLRELAWNYSETGEHERVVEIMSRLVAKEPRNPDFHYLLARGLVSTGKPEEGQKHMETSQLLNTKLQLARQIAEDIGTNVESVDNRCQVGKLHLEFGDEKEGLVWLFSVLNLKPDHLPTLQSLADYYQRRSEKEPQFRELAERYTKQLEFFAAANSNHSESANKPEVSRH